MRTAALTWGRWGAWAAHLLVDGRQACPTRHGKFPAGGRPEFRELIAEEIGPHGVHYGRTCCRCLRRFRELPSPR